LLTTKTKHTFLLSIAPLAKNGEKDASNADVANLYKIIYDTLTNLDNKGINNQVSISPTFHEQLFCTKVFCTAFL
jgi:hypothetical protein